MQNNIKGKNSVRGVKNQCIGEGFNFRGKGADDPGFNINIAMRSEIINGNV
jgi:hypothetical protein